METPDILMALNNKLSVKSGAILRSVSKTIKLYIVVKNYSFYRIFKQLSCYMDNIIEMLFEYDQDFINEEYDEDFYFPIENHILGLKIKEYVLNSNYYWVIMDFADTLININPNDVFPLYQLACDHCVLYTQYKPLQGLLIELCVDINA
jgi:hypothetical protein